MKSKYNIIELDYPSFRYMNTAGYSPQYLAKFLQLDLFKSISKYKVHRICEHLYWESRELRDNMKRTIIPLLSSWFNIQEFTL